MSNPMVEKRIATALERIADALEKREASKVKEAPVTRPAAAESIFKRSQSTITANTDKLEADQETE